MGQAACRSEGGRERDLRREGRLLPEKKEGISICIDKKEKKQREELLLLFRQGEIERPSAAAGEEKRGRPACRTKRKRVSFSRPGKKGFPGDGSRKHLCI